MLLSRKISSPYRVPLEKLTDMKEIQGKKGRSIKAELDEVLPRNKVTRSYRKDLDKHWDVIF